MYKHWRFPYIAMLLLLFVVYAHHSIVYNEEEAEQLYRYAPHARYILPITLAIIFFEAAVYYAFQTHVYSKKWAYWHVGLCFFYFLGFIPLGLLVFQPIAEDLIAEERFSEVHRMVKITEIVRNGILIIGHIFFISNIAKSRKLPPEKVSTEEGLLDEFEGAH